MEARKVYFEVGLVCEDCKDSIVLTVCYPQLHDTEDEYPKLINQLSGEQVCEACQNRTMNLRYFEIMEDYDEFEFYDE